MSNSLDIDVLWGGYYASVADESGNISVFRLLDLNIDTYHATLYRERFAEIPTLEELTSLVPFVGHVPIVTSALLEEGDLQLVGGQPLCKDDLDGYMCYLEAHGVPDDERNELAERLIAYSHQPPLRLRLELLNDELTIQELPSGTES